MWTQRGCAPPIECARPLARRAHGAEMPTASIWRRCQAAARHRTSAVVLGFPDLLRQVVRRELGVPERGGQRKREVQVGADADLESAAVQPVIQHVTAALAVLIEE